MPLLVEGISAFFELMLQSIGASLRILFGDPKSGGRRFSLKRLLLAPLPILLFIGVVRSIFLYTDWQAENRRAKVDATTEIVEQEVTRLAEMKKPNGLFDRHDTELLGVEDAWGQPLRVSYQRGVVFETLSVRSDGADEEAGTWDDIVHQASVAKPKTEIAVGLVGKAVEEFKRRRGAEGE